MDEPLGKMYNLPPLPPPRPEGAHTHHLPSPERAHLPRPEGSQVPPPPPPHAPPPPHLHHLPSPEGVHLPRPEGSHTHHLPSPEGAHLPSPEGSHVPPPPPPHAPPPPHLHHPPSPEGVHLPSPEGLHILRATDGRVAELRRSSERHQRARSRAQTGLEAHTGLHVASGHGHAPELRRSTEPRRGATFRAQTRLTFRAKTCLRAQVGFNRAKMWLRAQGSLSQQGGGALQRARAPLLTSFGSGFSLVSSNTFIGWKSPV